MYHEQFPQNLTITTSDFKNTDCLSIINNIDGNSYNDYEFFLFTKAKEKTDSGNLKSGKILLILADVCSMILKNPNSKNEPFQANAINNFTDDDISFFENILEFCEDYRIKSRLADILWVKKFPNQNKNIEIAIENYQKFSLEYDDILNDSKEAWERAIALSLQTKKSLEPIHTQLLQKFNNVTFDDGYYLSKIEKLLLCSNFDKTRCEIIVTKLELFANKFKNNKDFHRARHYFKSCKQWTNDIDKLNKCRIEIVELYILEAKSANTLAVGHLYEKAIREYRSIAREYREKYDININKIHQAMNASNLLLFESMPTIESEEVDLAEFMNYSVKEISGKNFEEALCTFANICPSRNVDRLYKKAIKRIKNISLKKSVEATYLASDGRVIFKENGINLEDEKFIFYEMIECYDLEIDLFTKTFIVPALKQLLCEHKVTKNDLYSLCSVSSSIPLQRNALWTEGLYYGFEKNFIVSTHVLIPQIEHFIRVKMKERGIKTSTIDNKDETETENGLSTLLNNEKITEVLDENILFELKALLTEKKGINLRNNVAHGLCEVNILNSTHAIYFWWLCLKLVLNNIPVDKRNL